MYVNLLYDWMKPAVQTQLYLRYQILAWKGSGAFNLLEIQPVRQQQTSEEVMGELPCYNRSVVCACALEPITVA